MKRWLAWILALFWSPPPVVEALPGPVEQPEPEATLPEFAEQPEPVRQRRSPAPGHAEESGRWYFRRDILDELPRYFTMIRRMKRFDADGYAMLSKLGAVVVSPKALTALDALDWRRLPGFGAIADVTQGEQPDDDFYPARFMYFQRMQRPSPLVEPANGRVFTVVGFWTSKTAAKNWKSKPPIGFPMSYHVEVSEGGVIRVLRERRSREQEVVHHDAMAKFYPRSYILHQEWEYPMHLCEGGYPPRRFNPRKRGAELFCYLVNLYMQSSLDIRVRVQKNNLVAAFAIDMLRTPYFFADRDVTVGESGRRRKIFHIVRTHQRQGRDGSAHAVRSHFRGERAFSWNGYSVNITMPGLHHTDLLALDVGGIEDLDPAEPMPAGFIGVTEMSRRIDRHVNV